jgi:hypothetical protein
MGSKLKSSFQLSNEGAIIGNLSDLSFFGAKSDEYGINILDDFIPNDGKQRMNNFDSHYSYYSDVKRLFEFEPIKILSQTKASSKNQIEKSRNLVAKSKTKLPSLDLTNSNKTSRLFEKYQSYKRKNVSFSTEQINKNDLIKNILNYDIYDGRKSTKYEDLTACLKKPSSPLFESNTPKYSTPRSTPVFYSNENSQYHNECDDQLLPSISFRDRYPIYYNFAPSTSSGYYIMDKDTNCLYEETSLNGFKSRLPVKTKSKKS